MKRKADDSLETRNVKKSKWVTFGSSFRNVLKTENAINALSDFIQNSAERDVASEYINAGGNAKEIVQLLKHFDGKKNFSIAVTVFSALRIVILKTVTDFLLMQSAVEDICEELLCSYSSTIRNILEFDVATNNRKIILQLLTSMVTLSDKLAKKILALFSMNSKLLRGLTDTRSTTARELRACFIHYLISFLDSDNHELTSELLNKKGLFISIIPGLTNDDPSTVTLVLNTLRTKIVENAKISKTAKVHTFNTHVLRSISQLYDYKMSASVCEGEPGVAVQSVREATHALLLLLCTSSKKGILFRDKRSDFGNGSNQLILSLVEYIEKPWNDELKHLLVIEILKVCPEFSKTVFRKLESYLQPTISTEWLNLMTFVKRIIEEHVFDVKMYEQKKIFTTIFSNFHPLIQKLLDYSSAEVHPNPIIRYHIISVMEKFLRKIKTILDDYEKTFLQRDRISQILAEHVESFLLKNLITSRCLINAWNAGVDVVLCENVSIDVNDEDPSPPSANAYFDTLADLLLLSGTLCPAYFSRLRVEENIYLADVDIDSLAFQFKRAELIFRIYNPKPDQEQFRFMMKQFIECYSQDTETIPDTVLKNVFLATGFFDGFEEEIFIWLYTIKKVGFQHPAIVSSMLIDTFYAVTRKNKKFRKDLSNSFREIDEVALSDIYLSQNLEYFFDLSEEFEQISKSSVLISPLVPAFLNVLMSYEKTEVEKENIEIIKSFASHFLVHLLHLQEHILGLLTIVNKYKNSFVDSCFYDYINFWMSEKIEIKRFQFPLVSDIASTWSQQIMMDDRVCEFSSIINKASEVECILLWNMTTFYINQLGIHDSLETKILHFVSCLKTIRKNLQPENAFSCLKSFLTTPRFIFSFFTGNGRICTPLSCIVMEVSLDFTMQSNAVPSCYSTLLSPYRLRFILFLLKEMDHCRNIDIDSVEKVFQFVALSNKTAICLLNYFSHLPAGLLTSESKKSFTGWTIVIQQLLKIVAKNLETPMEKENFISLLSILPQMLKLNIMTDCLEESLIDYLESFPHHLQQISTDFIINLITLHPKVDKLVLFLLPYFPENFLILQNRIMQNIEHFDARTLLEVARKTKNQETILSVICQNYLKELSSWYDTERCWEANDVLVSTIFRNFAERKACLKLCKTIESNWSEMNFRIEKCAIIRAIFENADKINRYIELLMSKYKQMLPEKSTNWTCLEIYDTLSALNVNEFSVNRELLLEFVEICFKNDLQTLDAPLIRAVQIICEKLSPVTELESINTVFQMMTTHSQFSGVMLSNCDIKCELIKLFLVLIKKSKSLMSSNHVPLLLGAYNATLSEVDQMLLQILQSYEENEIRFTHCRPYLWGGAAITRHSIHVEIGISLKRVPQANQVLDLLDIDIIKNTIKCFPLNRSLRPSKLIDVPLIEVYDPSFMLPLLSHLLAPESRISIRKFIRSGALSLLIMALSSNIPVIRTAAYHCLERFSFHLVSRDKEAQIWEHFLNAVKSGISTIREEVDTPPQLACIVATFFAHMCLIISEPLHSLYSPLTNFLLAKPVFDMKTIPNFFILYYSTDMKFRDHQEWILKVIRDGMRSKMDWMVTRKCYLFKILPQFYSNAVSNETMNIIILDIIANALQIHDCKLHLLTKCGLISWISQIIRFIPENCNHFLQPIIKILKLALMKNNNNIIDVMLLLFTKLLSRKIDYSNAEELILIFSNAYCSGKNNDLLDTKDMQLVITFAAPFLDVQRTKQFQNCLNYKSVIGITKECDKNLAKYVIKILIRFNKGSVIIA